MGQKISNIKVPVRSIHRVTILTVAVTIIIFFSQGVSFPEEGLKGLVLDVIDGDTLVVERGGVEKRVRLIGVDCPEMGRSGQPPEYLALESKKFVEETVLGKVVTLESDLEDSDSYGRALRYIYTSNGRSLNELLLEKGFALVLRRFPFRKKSIFLALQAEAEKGKRGLFSPGKGGVLGHSIANYEPVRVYPGPVKTYTLSYSGFAKPLIRKEDLPGEISKIRMYERRYGSEMVRYALKSDGYVPSSMGDKPGPAPGGGISYREAQAHMGEVVTVIGEIVRTKRTDKAIFLDFDMDWKNNLSLVIFGRDASKFSSPPHELFMGKMVKVRGKVKSYRGKPEIIINDPGKISIIEKH